LLHPWALGIGSQATSSRLADLVRASAIVPADSQDTVMEIAVAAARHLERKADATPW
jgi:hypothetical protein